MAVATSSQKYLGKFILGRKCGECDNSILGEEANLSWEMMEFCNESCLGIYQLKIGSTCSYCLIPVQPTSLGKYCVRFGYNIRQFCTNICLEEFKKGLQLCSYCQKDISGEDGFLAPIGDKAQFKEFCTKICMEKYEAMRNNRMYPMDGSFKNCVVCQVDKPVLIEYVSGNKFNSFCGEPCFVAFKYVNNVAPEKCVMCQKYFNNHIFDENSTYIDDAYHKFCSKSCLNIYITINRKIVCCSWCKVKKYNFDMIMKTGGDGLVLKMCSLNCLTLHKGSVEVDTDKRISCTNCYKLSQPLYHLKMVDASIKNFCSYTCVMEFQTKNTDAPGSPGPSHTQKKTLPATKKKPTAVAELPTMPIITNVQSLAPINGPPKAPPKARTKRKPTKKEVKSAAQPSPIVETHVRQQYIIKAAIPPPQRNIATLCKVVTAAKEVSCVPECVSAEIQTDEVPEKTKIVPLPVPVYMPTPIWMYTSPLPVPLPFPFPLPVPVFIPTTKNAAKGIMKELEKIQIETPADPLEAELLTMAEMVADDKREGQAEIDEQINTAVPAVENILSSKVASVSGGTVNNRKKIVILEDIRTTPSGLLTEGRNMAVGNATKGKKLSLSTRITSRRSQRNVVQKGLSASIESPSLIASESSEKPDANLCLKYTFGVNAWKQWVALKNSEIEKSSNRGRLFKSDILQLTADELNYSLCLFVKEVRKPNGVEYAPDTIYYLCLGIQQYLLENSRIDNIFCDPYYERFTDCLDEIGRKFSVLYNDAHYIVTRVEEEHLWESKQLGAHSPHVLLTTLMFFNTKHFNLSTVDEHMQLSFSHIMKHWKRNSQSNSKASGSRNVLLRFYPPHSSSDIGGRKKKVYEQQENEQNPLRCPVKLYEFYLSKCPESVKTRSDVFYLLPERSCVPDSPVWYSTSALPQSALVKMLHRVKMVKEINVALLSN